MRWKVAKMGEREDGWRKQVGDLGDKVGRGSEELYRVEDRLRK